MPQPRARMSAPDTVTTAGPVLACRMPSTRPLDAVPHAMETR